MLIRMKIVFFVTNCLLDILLGIFGINIILITDIFFLTTIPILSITPSFYAKCLLVLLLIEFLSLLKLIIILYSFLINNRMPAFCLTRFGKYLFNEVKRDMQLNLSLYIFSFLEQIFQRDIPKHMQLFVGNHSITHILDNIIAVLNF